MGITLTEKLWKSTRPKSAKDSGVAGAIALTDKHCKKAVGTMTATEVEAAGKAVDALDLALKTAQAGMASDASTEAKAAAPAIKGWRTECTDYKKDLTLRTYAHGRGQPTALNDEPTKLYQIATSTKKPPG